MVEIPTIAELRARTQPSAVLDRPNAEHWAGRYYLRKVSPYVTRVAIRMGLSANLVTWLMIIVGLAGAWSFAAPSAWPLVGVVSIQLYLLLDCVDGEVDRFNQTQSPIGVYLDRWGHYVVEGSMFAALGVRAAGGNETNYVIIGLAATTLALLSKTETDLVDSARLQSGLRPMPQTATTMKKSALAKGRRLVRFFPFHRLAHAAEASLVAGAAVVIDLLRHDLTATRIVIVGLLGIVALVMPLHLVSVLTSTRLTAD